MSSYIESPSPTWQGRGLLICSVFYVDWVDFTLFRSLYAINSLIYRVVTTTKNNNAYHLAQSYNSKGGYSVQLHDTVLWSGYISAYETVSVVLIMSPQV